MLDDPAGTTDEAWRGLASLGAVGVVVPKEHDGAGMTMVEAGIVAEELGAALHPGPWLSSAIAATRALVRMGASDKAAELLAGSAMAEAAFGPDVVAHYVHAAEVELAAFEASVTDWERFRGFERL